MAYDPEVKARAVADILKGDTWGEVAKRYGRNGRPLSMSLLSSWVKAGKESLAGSKVLTVVDGGPQTEAKNRSATGSKQEHFSSVDSEANTSKQKQNRSTSDSGDVSILEIPSSLEARRELFTKALLGLLLANIKMNMVVVQTCSDPAFIKRKPQAVNELVITANERADRLASLISGEQGEEEVHTA